MWFRFISYAYYFLKYLPVLQGFASVDQVIIFLNIRYLFSTGICHVLIECSFLSSNNLFHLLLINKWF